MKPWLAVLLLFIGLACNLSLAAPTHVGEIVPGIAKGTAAWKFSQRAQYATRRGFFTDQRTQPHFLPELRVDTYGRPVSLHNVPYSYCRKSNGAKHCEAVVKIKGSVHRFAIEGYGSAGEQFLDRDRLIAVVGNSRPFTLNYRDDKMRPVQLTFPGGLIAQCESKDWQECEAKAISACPSGYTIEKRFERRSHFSPVRTVKDMVAICNGAG